MIGKKIGKDNIYIHASADEMLPTHILKRAREAAGKALARIREREDNQRDFNFVITHPDYIEFVQAEDFDTAHEPVLGRRYRVDTLSNVIYIPRPNKPRVLHQRYKTVKPDYKGFDLEADREREKWYRSHFDGRRMAGAGFHHKWMEMLEEISAKEA